MCGVSNRRRTPLDRSLRPPAQPVSHTRASVNRRSHALLSRLHAAPRWFVPAATVALVLVGMFSPVVIGGLCLLLVTAFLLWLAYLAWPRLSRGARLSRLLIAGLVGGVAIARMTGAGV